mmetsp:Transcript_26155/g.82760  ORF Transcript_26155/g.82760 Transcript_26155/m.82760 type:complete len:231 (+) Transcript_26155:160-852(+)
MPWSRSSQWSSEAPSRPPLAAPYCSKTSRASRPRPLCRPQGSPSAMGVASPSSGVMAPVLRTAAATGRSSPIFRRVKAASGPLREHEARLPLKRASSLSGPSSPSGPSGPSGLSGPSGRSSAPALRSSAALASDPTELESRPVTSIACCASEALSSGASHLETWRLQCLFDDKSMGRTGHPGPWGPPALLLAATSGSRAPEASGAWPKRLAEAEEDLEDKARACGLWCSA